MTSTDLSSAMLSIAERTNEGLDYTDMNFVCTDAEPVGSTFERSFDAVVGLPLMHRVPSGHRRRMFTAFAKAAPFTAKSFGVPSRLHRLRRPLLRIRQLGHEPVSWDFITHEDSIDHVVMAKVPVPRFGSLKWLLPLRSR